ncbi:MAG: class I SAM-dependent rRNA methyltransferase [Ilumatobacteraceae bacterium]
MLRLHRGRERSILRRHPWVFSGAVDRVEGSAASGDTVVVVAHDGTVLGRAAYSPESQLRARMWTFDDDTAVDERFIATRVVEAAARRNMISRRDSTDSHRVVFAESDGLPGVIVDRFGSVAVCQFTSAGAERWRGTVAEAVSSLVGVTDVYERSDTDARQREGLEPRSGVLHGGLPPADLVAHERQFRFPVDVVNGHKTGFYLDQRHGRHAVAEWAEGRRVLNVFSYTGAFSVVAAASGAEAVFSIDSSGPAHAIARHSATLNGVEIGELLEADAFSALRGLRDRARSFDLILLDPPKLAASERHLDRATRAYKDLNLLAIKLLAPGGCLMTWSCSGAMSADLFQKVVAGAALDAGRSVHIVGRLHQPEDHPILLDFPEAEYLKGLVLTV